MCYSHGSTGHQPQEPNLQRDFFHEIYENLELEYYSYLLILQQTL